MLPLFGEIDSHSVNFGGKPFLSLLIPALTEISSRDLRKHLAMDVGTQSCTHQLHCTSEKTNPGDILAPLLEIAFL